MESLLITPKLNQKSYLILVAIVDGDETKKYMYIYLISTKKLIYVIHKGYLYVCISPTQPNVPLV